MNRIDLTLNRLRQQRRSGLVTYFTAGDPDFDSSLDLLQSLAAAGADIIELGLPFSDPVADGPVIQAAHIRALAAGQTIRRTLELVARLREQDDQTPVVLMGYLNPVMQYGEDSFMQDAVKSGVDGLILVDLPLEHAGSYNEAARKAGLHLIRMTTPTSDDLRLPKLLAEASGFVYHVSLNGVTGAAACASTTISAVTAKLRKYADLPIALGFGIRDSLQLQALAGQVELIVMGTKLVETLSSHGVSTTLNQVREFAEVLKIARSGSM
jgi:tryptophan synthase alpha chain